MREIMEQAASAERIKVICPGCGYSKMIPAKAVPAAGARATCPNCAVEIFIASPQAVRQPVALTPPPAPAQEISPAKEAQESVLLSAPVKFQTFSTYDNRFKGKGMVMIDGDAIQVTARRRHLFSFGRKTERYPLSSLRNLTRKGKIIRFALPVGKKPWQAVLVCEDEKTAVAMAARLPAVVDTSLYTVQQAGQELKEQLASLPSGTPVTWLLLAMNFLAYGAIAVAAKDWLHFDAAYLSAVGGNFSPLTTSGQWWRLLTAVFLHLNIVHLLVNMYALYALGHLAERLYGARAYLGTYLLAGIAGSCGTLLFSPQAVSVGASGAIFGLMGVLGVFLATDHEFLSAGARKKLFTNFAAYGIYSLMQGFGRAGIDNAAHVGGLLAGIIMAWAIGTPLRLKKETTASWFAGRVAVGTCVVVLCAGIVLAAAPKQGDEYKIHVALNDLLKELGAKEVVLTQEAKKLNVRLTELGQDDHSEEAQEAGRELIRIWRNTYEGYPERVAAFQPKTEGVKRRQEVLLSYLRLKQEGGELMAAAIAQDGDQRLIEESRRRMADAGRLVEELKKPVRWY